MTAVGLGVLLFAGPSAAAIAAPAEPSGPAATEEADQRKSGEQRKGGQPKGGDQVPEEAHPAPAPPTNENLPDEVDQTLDWQYNISCDPVLRPGIEAFGNLLGQHYGQPAYSTFRSCLPRQSEHYDGRGLDWPLNADDPRQRAIGDAVAAWLTENDGEMARRFGIQGIIWNGQSWHTYAVDQGWGPYTGPSPHTDHMHFSFTWDGALMRTSWWTGVALTVPDHGPCRSYDGQYAARYQGPRTEPCPTDLPELAASDHADVVPGGRGESVSMAQEALGVPDTGVLDEETVTALMAWQKQQGLPVTGVLDQATFMVMAGEAAPPVAEGSEATPLPDHLRSGYTPHKHTELVEGDRGDSVKALQRGLDVKADGVFGPKTQEALLEFTSTHELLTEASVTSPLVWHLLELRDHPTMPYRSLTLAHKDAGEAQGGEEAPEVTSRGLPVTVLQEQLGIEADGIFGPQTEKAVIEAQAQAGLPQTGIVDGPTWVAVEAVARAAAEEKPAAKEQASTKQAAKADKASRGDKPRTIAASEAARLNPELVAVAQ